MDSNLGKVGEDDIGGPGDHNDERSGIRGGSGGSGGGSSSNGTPDQEKIDQGLKKFCWYDHTMT